MKWNVLPTFAFLLSIAAFPLNAQSALLDQLADQACSCISQKDVDKMSQEEMQMEMGFCIMEAVSKNQEAFQKEYGALDPSNQQAMTKLGEEIGMKMAFKCPETLMKVAQVQTQVTTSPAAAATESITGTIRSIDGDEFALITLSDESGRSHKLLWLSYFKGSERIIGEPEKAVGKKVKVSYQNIEAFSPKAGEYFNRKQIVEVVFLD